LHWLSHDSDPPLDFDPSPGLSLRENPRPSLTGVEHVAFLVDPELMFSLGLASFHLFDSWHFCWLDNFPELKGFILLMPQENVGKEALYGDDTAAIALSGLKGVPVESFRLEDQLELEGDVRKRLQELARDGQEVPRVKPFLLLIRPPDSSDP
jgi:hypothetical protein